MKKLSFILVFGLLLFLSCSKDSTTADQSQNDQEQQATTDNPVLTGAATDVKTISADISAQVLLSAFNITTTDIKFGVLICDTPTVLYGFADDYQGDKLDSDGRFTIHAYGLARGATHYYRAYFYLAGTITYGEVKSFETGVPSCPSGAVDLGLSVCWASCNIGTSSIKGYGKHFAWADLVGQTLNYPNWSGDGFSKKYPYKLDANGNLLPEYDVAHVTLGGKWRMPTKLEFEELMANCNITWHEAVNYLEQSRLILTSKKKGFTDKYIYMPVSGEGADDKIYSFLFGGSYWSSTISTEQDRAYNLSFGKGGQSIETTKVNFGLNVRPVTD